MKSNLKTILFYVILIGFVILAVFLLFGSGNKDDEIKYDDIIGYISNAEKTYLYEKDNLNEKPAQSVVISSAEITNDFELILKLKIDGEEKKVAYTASTLVIKDLVERLSAYAENNPSMEFEPEPEAKTPWWLSFLPYVIIIIVFLVIWFFVMNQAMGGKGSKINNFGKARVKTPSSDKNAVKFTDVAGADEEKEELEEIVEFLKAPAKFSKLGAKIPHGVLLVGPPGTGKTLLAKAVAGEAGVPFFSISGSDFVEMYVGVGASRVRDLFENARKAPASIVFIDEIDAVGRHRGAGLGGGHDEREQTLNQLLVEMDGFGSHEGIIVIAAPNRPDILDPALLRPGRFDRQITVGYPDLKGRAEILKVHAKNKPIGEDVDFNEVAKSTVGFTGADLANLLNEAALLAARANKSLIGMDDIEDAFIKVIAGPKKKSMVRNDDERKKTAYHEAGHAIVAYALPSCPPVQQISIIPSGRALGYTLNPPVEDKYSEYKQELKEKIAELLGGRAAEEIIFGDISGGASNDIERATAIARKMVTKLGMSDILGPIKYGSDHSDEVFLGRDFSSTPNYSQEIAAKIDNEIASIIKTAYENAKQILRDNIDKLHFVSEFLVKNEVMDGDQFKASMEDGATMESVEAIAEEKKEKRKLENEERAKRNAEREAAERERLEREAEERRRAEEERMKQNNSDGWFGNPPDDNKKN